MPTTPARDHASDAAPIVAADTTVTVEATPDLTVTADLAVDGRTGPDACPGSVDLFPAADGLLARVRVPGGYLLPAQARVLADLAAAGADAVDLTARGNLQLRGLPAAVAAGLPGLLASAGLLPSAAHDRSRNVVASPLAGLGGGLDLKPVVEEFDVLLCASPALVDLPGRFLVAFDGGTGDVAALDADVTLLAESPDRMRLYLAGRPTTITLAPHEAAGVAVKACEAFLTLRGNQTGIWRLRELPGGPGPVALACQGRLLSEGLAPSGPAPLLGRVPGVDDAVIVGAPLGRLTPDQLRLVASFATSLRVTPWRSLVLTGVSDADETLAALAAAGLLVTSAEPLAHISACSGLGACERSRDDVRAHAAAAAAPANGGTVHFAGCERACGRPAGAQLLVALGSGFYRRGAQLLAVAELS